MSLVNLFLSLEAPSLPSDSLELPVSRMVPASVRPRFTNVASSSAALRKPSTPDLSKVAPSVRRAFGDIINKKARTTTVPGSDTRPLKMFTQAAKSLKAFGFNNDRPARQQVSHSERKRRSKIRKALHAGLLSWGRSTMSANPSHASLYALVSDISRSDEGYVLMDVDEPVTVIDGLSAEAVHGTLLDIVDVSQEFGDQGHRMSMNMGDQAVSQAQNADDGVEIQKAPVDIPEKTLPLSPSMEALAQEIEAALLAQDYEMEDEGSDSDIPAFPSTTAVGPVNLFPADSDSNVTVEHLEQDTIPTHPMVIASLELDTELGAQKLPSSTWQFPFPPPIFPDPSFDILAIIPPMTIRPPSDSQTSTSVPKQQSRGCLVTLSTSDRKNEPRDSRAKPRPTTETSISQTKPETKATRRGLMTQTMNDGSKKITWIDANLPSKEAILPPSSISSSMLRASSKASPSVTSSLSAPSSSSIHTFLSAAPTSVNPSLSPMSSMSYASFKTAISSAASSTSEFMFRSPSTLHPAPPFQYS
ncbi:hypothetical protein EW146_g7013 [Bondarzewia mesenterica]|uniref:Uncharacterized protein n=1 Tax=Bondarzewia mesenterica TaxID=1095465 RepID=A0A4S4LLZ1_9AGAM|nr:hypothetical protein EW146_g7013 [Bondarzewia mesenterica]